MDRVKLTEQDLQIIIEIAQMITDWKFRVLQKANWQRYCDFYLPKLIEQLSSNSFPVNDRAKNTFTWLEDQILHSRYLAPGIRLRNAVPLKDIKLGQEALKICRLAVRGNRTYQTLQERTTYQDLFTSDNIS